MNGKVLYLALVTFFVISLLPGVQAAIITVNQSGGANYTNITDAINAAINGDKILMNRDTYSIFPDIVVDKEITIDFGMSNGDVNGGLIHIEVKASNVNLSNFIMTGDAGGWGIYSNGAGTNWTQCVTQYQNLTFENIQLNASGGFDFSGVSHVNIKNFTSVNNGEPIKVLNSCDINVTAPKFYDSGKFDINDYTAKELTVTGPTWDLGRVHAASNINIAKLSGAPLGAPELAGSVGVYKNISATITNAIATITMGYNQSLVDLAGINEATLRMYHLNSTNDWEALPSVVDTEANEVKANTTAFSAFGLAGDPAEGSSQASTSGSSASSHAPPPAPAPEQADLSKINLFFKTNTIVVYGSEVDKPVAEALAKHFSPDAPLPMQTTDKGAMKNRNYILVGGPVANRGVEELNTFLPLSFRRPLQGDKWSFSDGMEDQEAGSIQILDNPNDSNYKVLVVAGLTRRGTLGVADLLMIPGQRMNGKYVLAN